MVIAIIIAVIGIALLLAVGGIIFFVMKRKGAQPARPEAPPQQISPGFGAAEAPPAWSAPQQQPAWGVPAESAPPAEYPPASEPPAHVGWPDQASPSAPPPSAPQQHDAGYGNVMDPAAYAMTPSAGPGEPLPNPELFMTTPSAPRPTAPAAGPAELRADDGTTIQLGHGMMRFGRHPECDIVVPTPGASRQHAEIEFRDGAWFVTDLNSGNGTWVNGVRVKTHQLTSGDELRIDQTRFTFNV